jgi:hypothetical protein
LWDDLSRRILATTVPDGKPGVEIPVRARDGNYGDQWLRSEQDAQDTSSTLRAWLKLLEVVCSKYIRYYETHYVSDFLDLVLHLHSRLDNVAPYELDSQIQKLSDYTRMLVQRLRAGTLTR